MESPENLRQAWQYANRSKISKILRSPVKFNYTTGAKLNYAKLSLLLKISSLNLKAKSIQKVIRPNYFNYRFVLILLQ